MVAVFQGRGIAGSCLAPHGSLSCTMLQPSQSTATPPALAAAPAAPQAPLQPSDTGVPIEMLRASLLAARPKRSLSSAALGLLEQPALKQLPAAARRVRAAHRVLQWIQARTGVGPRHLALACQMLVAYTTGWHCFCIQRLLHLQAACSRVMLGSQPCRFAGAHVRSVLPSTLPTAAASPGHDHYPRCERRLPQLPALVSVCDCVGAGAVHR